MGTETFRSLYLLLNRGNKQVKLNNPLMGTETLTSLIVYLSFIHIKVKLNNPLMGTETGIQFYGIRHKRLSFC